MINALADPLDLLHHALLQEIEDGVPVIRRPVAEAQFGALLLTIQGFRLNLLTQTRWRHAIASLKHVVKTAQTAKTAGIGNFGHRQCGFSQ